MTILQELDGANGEDLPGSWSADIDISRTPSPGIPAKRVKLSLEDVTQDLRETTTMGGSELNNLLRLERSPQQLGYDPPASTFKELWESSNDSYSQDTVRGPQARELDLQELTKMELKLRKKKMQTGCIPCLYVAIRATKT